MKCAEQELEDQQIQEAVAAMNSTTWFERIIFRIRRLFQKPF